MLSTSNKTTESHCYVPSFFAQRFLWWVDLTVWKRGLFHNEIIACECLLHHFDMYSMCCAFVRCLITLPRLKLFVRVFNKECDCVHPVELLHGSRLVAHGRLIVADKKRAQGNQYLGGPVPTFFWPWALRHEPGDLSNEPWALSQARWAANN